MPEADFRMHRQNVTCCECRNVQTSEEFSRVYLSHTNDNFWEAEPRRIEEILQRMAVLHPASHTTMEGEDDQRVPRSPLVMDEGGMRKQGRGTSGVGSEVE